MLTIIITLTVTIPIGFVLGILFQKWIAGKSKQSSTDITG